MDSAATGGVPLATKLCLPKAPEGVVQRPRLMDVLRAGLHVPLTLVTAPAGWGKSVLVTDWIELDGVPAGWVSLDRGDSDPMLFWRYLLLAAGTAVEGHPELVDAATAALRRLGAGGVQIERDVLPPFLNALVLASAPVVLVLDDFHLIGGSSVHEALAGGSSSVPLRPFTSS